MGLDSDCQPLNSWLNRGRRIERDVAEMLGLVKGVLADGVVTEAEADLLRDWVAQRPEVADQWPANILRTRLGQIFADGVVDASEREDLAELLASIVGGKAGILAGEDASTSLPLDCPPPSIAWPGSVFVLTGKFVLGPRAECEQLILARGGLCGGTVTLHTNYLVIGTFGSRDWIQTSFGRKIETAVEYRSKGSPLAIVSEEHWAQALM